ncbi:MAG: class I mannose-6-phosphate isomerase [Bacteroidales bacterium]|nr:class I mannose-6-phosphate isomerase [Bacteroidales bacterium]
MYELYPLKLAPLFFEKPWGGRNIAKYYPSYQVPIKCGEAWLVSAIEGKSNLIINGHLQGNELSELIEVYMEDLIGEKNFIDFGEQMPVLIKMIDTASPLSIQVHPDDVYAQQLRNYRWGKNEMWYILQAGPSSFILNGFSNLFSEQYLQEYIGDHRFPEMLNKIYPKSGDMFFVRARKVHAIGPEITLIEIQQPSDITFRIYDWDRKDEHGSPRELHLEEALMTINVQDTDHGLLQPHKKSEEIEKIFHSHFFNVNKILLPASKVLARNYLGLDSFVVWVVVKGMISFQYQDMIDHLHTGEILLIPASLDEISFYSKQGSEILEIYRSYEES